ncbi:19c1cb6b-239e-4802-8012-564b4d8d53ef [Sclerotinia trifoliorum]|uniref:19c1cb6b-239e-4802-8012-564b4d8d53ef n=1 Tax=Sclerotinia trifoliorum TaxID=28548 RepID=A0A8H2W054_9HELO|nr:19c1cb6b-239e-4802-8012-564b4d8d53ef [Sclerotinia trifoliorum]
MSSTGEESYGGAENIVEFLDVFDSQDPFTPHRVQPPANFSTPAQPQHQMHGQLSTVHTSTSNVRQEPPQMPVLTMPSSSVVLDEPSSPEVSNSPDGGNVTPAHQGRKSSSVLPQSPSISNDSQQDTLSPTVEPDINDGSLTGSQHPDETSAVVIPSIESPDLDVKEESQGTLDHGRSQVVSDDMYDASTQGSNLASKQQYNRQRPSVFGTPLISNAHFARTSSHLQAPKLSCQTKQPDQVLVGSDSDDDCFITEVRVARPRERRMPAMKYRSPVVKDEPALDPPANLSTSDVANGNFERGMSTFEFDREPSPTEEEMLAAQATIIPPAAQSRAEDIHTPGSTNESRKRRRNSMAYTEEQVEIDNAMQVNEDDNNWMHAQGNDGDETQEEYENLVILRNALNNDMKRKGNLSLDEKAELIRINHTLARLDRLSAAKARAAEDEDDEEDTLFIPETHRRVPNVDNGGGPSSSRNNGDENVDDDVGLARMLQEEFDRDVDDAPTNKRKPKKTRRAPPKNAREFAAREEERRTEKERAKAQKKKAAGGGKGRKTEKAKAVRKGKGRGKDKGKNSKKGSVKVDEDMRDARFMGPRGGQDEIGQLILDDLMNCDAIGDRLQDPIFNIAPEPEIDGRTRTKASQLQQLFANIPEGSSKSKGKSDKAKLLQASRSFGYAQVKAVSGKWLVKGMRSTLYHHQLLGAQWMVSRELSSEPPHGGLLADSMGLGKTVQTLACMVGNPPTKEDRERGVTATLIVVPSSVISQWLEEIETHVECKKVCPKFMQYKASMHIPDAVLKDLDIVVTSYTEVMKQFPFPDRKGREDIARYGYKKWWKNAHEELGALHKINWRRVVLDEAHAIKNNSARTSLACQNLKSVYRWCLTGTPLLNRLEELFPYLRFLKANYSMDWKTFQQYFCDPDADDCTNRIATLLSYAMMRRTMKTTILNRPIITLPKPHPVMQQLNFSREERIIYRITESRFRANLNVFLANGTAQRAYGVFFVQLLRLRQCTSHPFMLERTMRESWTTEDVEQLRRELGKFSDTNVTFYEQCKLWVAQSEEERAEAKAKGEKGAEAIPFGISKFGESFKFDSALDSLNEEELYTRITCHLCSDVPNEPIITTCSHIFCQSCLTNHLHSQIQDSDGDDTFNVCPKCDIIFTSAEPYTDLEIPDDDNMDSSPSQTAESEGSSRGTNKRCKLSDDSSRRPHRIKSKGVDALGFEPFTKDNTWVTRSDYDPAFPLIPSAKTTALKALLLKGFEEAPDDKVVIYVQFRTLARIIGRMCAAEGWGFLYLTGDASLEHRSKAIKEFRVQDNIQILIAGLKCGGLGLNFPFANRCISLDLWWNHGVEQQAFGRIFRIGQNKETWMTRLVVRNSVDMRLLGMQDWKLRACEKAIDNNGQSGASGSGGGTLNLSQLARLFGFLRTDEDDNLLRIEPDYEDEWEDDGVIGSGASQQAPSSGSWME